MDVVVSAQTPQPHHLAYASSLGIPSARYVLFSRNASNAVVDGPLACGAHAITRVLVPNHGRDGAAFFSYVADNYGSLPDVVAFMHHHVGGSWHFDCPVAMARQRLYYDRFSRGWLGPPITLTHKRHQPVTPPDYGDPMWHTPTDSCADELRPFNISVPRHPSQGAYSCCANFVVRGATLEAKPLSLYTHLRDVLLATRPPHDHRLGQLCFEFIIWAIMGAEKKTNDAEFYTEADADKHRYASDCHSLVHTTAS